MPIPSVAILLPAIAGLLAAPDSNRFDRAIDEALRRARGVAETMTGPYERPLAMWPLAEAFARRGKIGSARQALGKIDDADSRSVGAGEVAQAQAIAGDLPGAIETIAQFKTGADTLFGVAQALADRGNWQHAERAARLIQDPTLRDSAIRMVVSARAKSGDIRGGKEMAGSIGYPIHRVSAHVSVAEELFRRKRINEAFAIIGDMRAYLPSVGLDSSKTSCLVEIAKCLARWGYRERAAQWIAQAVAEAKRIPNVMDRQYYRDEAIAAYCLAGDLKRATKEANSIGIPKERERALEQVTWAAASISPASAIDVASLIHDRSIHDYALSGAADSLKNRGMIADATLVAKRIRDRSRREYSLAHIAFKVANSGHPQEALERLMSIRSSTWRAKPFGAACRAIAHSSLDRAMQIATRGRSKYERLLGCIGVANGLMDLERKPRLKDRDY